MRKLVCFAVPFAGAALLCCYFLPLTWTLPLGLVCLFLALPALLLKGDARTRALLLTLGAAAGLLWFRGWTALFAQPAQAMAGASATVEATALDYPRATSRGVWLDVRLEEGATVRLYAGEDCAPIRPGDRLTLTASFRGADYLYGEKNTYYAARAVFLLAYANDGAVTWSRPAHVPIYLLPRVWARALSRGLDAAFPDDLSPLLRAVVLGDKTDLAGATVTAFNRAGLAHVLVVSGLHVSMLLQGLTVLFRRRRRWLAPVAIPLLVLFVLLVGCTPSAVRAAAMSALVLVAPLARREADPPTSLCAVLLLLLLQNPYAAASVSLQLSFASVAGILLLTDPLSDWLYAHARPRREGRLGRLIGRVLGWMWGSLSVTLGAMIFTVPLIALWFGAVSLAAPVANLLTLWAAPFVFLGGLLCGLLALLWLPAATALALPVGLLCRYILWVAGALSALPFAALTLESVYYRLWLAGTYGVVVCGCVLGRPRRVILPLCCPVVLLCAAIFFTQRTYAAAPLTVTALDVGQGAATAFYSAGATALVDCGGSAAVSAGDIAADHFQALGLSRLDLLVFTHLDDDHYNGAAELFARLEVGAVALPRWDGTEERQRELEELARAEGAQVIYVEQTWDAALGECVLTLLPPMGGGTTNEAGLFVLATAGDFDVLITGDGDSAVESMLVKYRPVPDIEVLLVGHHGSNNSTSAEFLAAVRPEYAVISSGYNTYGHPDARTLERLADAGADVYRTDLQGSVTLRVGQVKSEK